MTFSIVSKTAANAGGKLSEGGIMAKQRKQDSGMSSMTGAKGILMLGSRATQAHSPATLT